jgi:DNA (cytosine-5)-methyltransferase 1
MKQQTYVATHDVAGTMESRQTSGGFSNSADHAAAGYMALAVDCYNGAINGDVTHSVRAGNGNELGGVPSTLQNWAVRRLTPRECERLQGFPDDYTLVPSRGKPAADGPRYKALGNSMAVNCIRWIGRRIEMVDAL